MPRSGLVRDTNRTCRHARFNEAGAIMPRSGSRSVQAQGRRRPGFNEAGAIMPRSGRCPSSNPAAVVVSLQ